MKIKFWGVRGSIAVPGPDTIRYGGNTSCLELKSAGEECIILEAGTGLRPLGLDLVKRKTLPPIHLFISHTHWDHIQGFPFFVPCYLPGAKVQVKGPVHFIENKSLKSIFEMQMKYEFFPISNEQLAASIDYQSIAETDFELAGLKVKTQFMNHPILSLGYRLTEKDRSVVYTGDHEPYQISKDSVGGNDTLLKEMSRAVEGANRKFIDFIRNANLLVVDCQYTPEEYRTSKRKWGHSSWDYCLKWMKEANVERMILTHHDPSRSDQAIDEMLAAARVAAVEFGLDPSKILMAQEGLELEV